METYSFGQWVQRRRRALDLTQVALAVQVGCAPITIQKIEADERRPSPQIAALLAAQLQIPAAQRVAFLSAARGIQAVDQLATPTADLRGTAPPAAPLPTDVATLTFLFTDIQGSTALWEQHPTAMRTVLARHDALLRQIVQQHQGQVFKTVGDAVHAVFADPSAALAAALAGQRALQAADWAADGLPEPLRVRMALHLGTARLRDAGHGGQILLGAALAELLRSQLPDDVTLTDLGRQRLRDLALPEAVYQVTAPDLPQTFPALRTLDPRPGNLPTALTPLVGRTRDLAAVAALLGRADVRLLTLTGSGGTGKTRLALAVAAASDGTRYPDGVWWVDLAPVTAAEQVAATIVQTLGLPLTGQAAPEAVLRAYLRGKQLLLVLDNFEQVVAAAPVVAGVVQAAAGVQVLVTSRVALELRGEHVYPIAPLGLPPHGESGGGANLAELTQYDAVKLLIERAEAVQHRRSFKPSTFLMERRVQPHPAGRQEG